MSWTSLFMVLVLCVFTIALIFVKFWPRDENGDMMDPDEVEKFIGSKDTPPGMPQRAFNRLIIVIASIMLLAMALTDHTPKSDNSNHDD